MENKYRNDALFEYSSEFDTVLITCKDNNGDWHVI